MRITQPMIQNQIQTINQTAADSGKFAKGQQIKAVVLNVLDGMALLDVGGDVVQAKNMGSKTLLPGQQITATAVGVDDGAVVLKLIDGDATQTNGLNQQLSDQLKAMGVSGTEKNMTILKTMHEQSLPVSKEALVSIKQDTLALEQLVKQVSAGETSKIQWQVSAKQNIVIMPTTAQTEVNQTGQIGQTELNNQVSLTSSDASSQALNTLSKLLTQPASIGAHNMQEGQPIEQTTIGKIYGEIEHLNDQLTSKLAALSENSDKMQQTVTFMHKHSIPNTALNTVLSSQLLSGKTGVMSSVLEILLDAKDVLPEQLKEITTKLSQKIPKFNEMPEKLDGEKLQNLVKEGLELQKILAETKFTSKTGEKAEHMAVAKQTQSLFAETPIAWQNIQIPIRLKNDIEDIDIYVKGDESKGGRINPDDGLIYIALNTNHMDTVKVKLGFKKERIQIDFICAREDVSDYMAKHTEALVNSVKKMTSKDVVVYFNTNEQDINIAQFDKVDLKSMTVFDMKV